LIPKYQKSSGFAAASSTALECTPYVVTTIKHFKKIIFKLVSQSKFIFSISFLANHHVAEFQLVVVSHNQPIVPRKHKHGCFINNHVCIFLQQHIDCEKKTVEILQQDDL